MEYENRNQNDSVFSRKIRAGRRRTYFFDVRTTRGNDYYLTITESKKRHDGNGYERHKIFLYKEDFNKFLAESAEVINFIKSKMPDFDFDAFNHVYETPQGEQHMDENAVSESDAVSEEKHNEPEPENESSGKDQDDERAHEDDDDLKM
ncbi:MAG: DUF3276 family protein [Chitinophagales bacterium]|nr:DUF3276 family protein [Chitinophagales bacterium]